MALKVVSYKGEWILIGLSGVPDIFGVQEMILGI